MLLALVKYKIKKNHAYSLNFDISKFAFLLL